MSKRPPLVRRLGYAAVATALCGFGTAQAAETPANPRQALAFYVGTWTAPNGEYPSYVEKCSWLPGARGHIVCRSSEMSAGGPQEAIGIFSYDQAAGEYVCHTFWSDGRIRVERGEAIPNGFRFNSEKGSGANKVLYRLTLTEGAEGRVFTISESSKAGGPWIVDKKVEFARTRP
jgi:hypothetical protein